MRRWRKFAAFPLSCWAALGCTTTATHGGIRAESAKRWNCPESAISVDNESPNVVRASGCGQSAIYVCKGGNAPADASGQLQLEQEHRMSSPGGCGTWTRQAEH
jgi:hypothetical protein